LDEAGPSAPTTRWWRGGPVIDPVPVKAPKKENVFRGRKFQLHPPTPPWRLPPPNPAVGGVWFGHNRRLAVEGPDIAGRWIHAKNEFWERGFDKPLPKVFKRGGDERKVWEKKGNPRVNAVMGLVTLHHMQFRQWSAEHPESRRLLQVSHRRKSHSR